MLQAHVHDDVVFASGEPPAFEHRQHLAARLVDVDDSAVIGEWQHRSMSTRSSVGTVLGVSVSAASGHSFPSSPLGFLEHPNDRINRWDKYASAGAMTPSVSRCASRTSANTPAPQHTLLQTRDTMSAKATTALGSRESGRPRATPEVCENHLRGVSMCACSKKDGSALFHEAEALRHGPVALDAGERAEHCFTSSAELACHHQHRRQLARRQQVSLPRSRCPSARQRVLRLWPS